MKKLFDRRMCGFVLVQLLMFAAIKEVSDPVQQASVITMFFNISLATFTILVGGNVVEKIKTPNAS